MNVPQNFFGFYFISLSYSEYIADSENHHKKFLGPAIPEIINFEQKWPQILRICDRFLLRPAFFRKYATVSNRVALIL